MHSAKLPFQTLHPDCMPKTQSLQKGKKQSTTTAEATAEGAGSSLDFPELPQHVKPPVCSGPRPEAGILQSSLKGSPHRSPAMLRPVTLKISLGEYNSLSHPHHDGTMASKSSLMRIGQNKTLQLVRDCYGYDMTAWRRISRSACQPEPGTRLPTAQRRKNTQLRRKTRCECTLAPWFQQLRLREPNLLACDTLRKHWALQTNQCTTLSILSTSIPSTNRVERSMI